MEHTQDEQAGLVNHQYTLTGNLQRVERKVSKVGPPPVQIMVAPAPDLALRRLLVELGVVTEEQLAGIVELANRLPVTTPDSEPDK
jgi:hypothetical protein